MKIKISILFLFLGVLLVPAGQAHASTILYDNITGQTIDDTKPVAGNYTPNAWTVTTSGTLSDVLMPVSIINGYSHYYDVGFMQLFLGSWSGGASPLDCQTATDQIGNFGVNTSNAPGYPAHTPIVDWPMTGTQCNLTAGTSYSLHSTGWSSRMQSPGVVSDPYGNPYFQAIESSAPTGCTYGTKGTCIDSVIPADDTSILQYASSSQALATSTTFAFGSGGYIDPTDYQTGAYVEHLYQSDDYDQVASALCDVGGCRTQIKYPISASGVYSVSTTTDIERVGNYTMTTDIKVPVSVSVFNFFSFNVPSFLPFSEKTIVSTTTNFQVAHPSSLDLVKQKLGQTYLAVGLTNHGSASSTADLITGCAFTSITGIFDLTSPNNIFSCVVGFVSSSLIPSTQQLQAISANFQTSITTRPPIGYITRFSAIVSGQAIGTSTLPNFTFAFPSLLGMGGSSVTFNFWGNLMGSTSPFATATTSSAFGSKTFRQIVEPGWDIIVLCVLAFLIIWDALKIKH